MSSSSDQLGDKLYSLAVAFRTPQAPYVVAKLGVADLLVNGPLDAKEIAGKLRVDTNSLFRVMRALAAQGIFTQDHADRFGLLALSRLLVSNTAQSMRYQVIFLGEEYYRAAGEMLHTVKTGETAFTTFMERVTSNISETTPSRARYSTLQWQNLQYATGTRSKPIASATDT